MRYRLFWLIFFTLLMPAAAYADGPALAPEHRVQAGMTFKELGEKTLTLRTIYDQSTLHFNLPAGRSVERATLNLDLSHDKKLLAEISDLTIVLNAEPVADIILSPDNATRSFIPVDLPPEAFISGENTFTFRLNQRLRTKGCGDVGDSNLWTRIHSDSFLEMETVDTPIAADLGQYPQPFTGLSMLADSPRVLFVLPDAPSDAELTAAAEIAAALGQSAAWEQPPLNAISVGDLESADTQNHHIFAIGTANRNPLAKNAAPGLAEMPSPFNPNRLLLAVSGRTDAELLQAAHMLATASARDTLSGTAIAAADVSPQPMPARATRTTFAELGFDDRRVRGIGPHDIYFPIDIPYDWKPTSDATIEVRFSHASVVLDAATSKMSAFINGFKVSDVALTKRNDTNGRLVIRLSPRQIHPGRNWLHLGFDLHVKNEDCNFRYLQEAWAVISAEKSVVNLAHVNSEPPLELRYLPSPLVTPQDLSKDIFVLSPQPSPAELTALVRTAAKLGTYSTADTLRPHAQTSGTFDPATAPEAHVIAIGMPETNSLLEKYDSALPQHLIIPPENGQNGGREILEPLPASIEYHSGYIQLLPAPWDAREVLIALNAFDEPLLENTVAAFPTLGKRLKLQGNLAVIMPDQAFGLNMGSLATTQLPNTVRIWLAGLLIGGFALVGGLSWWAFRRRNGR